METISINQLLSYLVPFLGVYIGWLHKQVIRNQIDIAVNTSKDDEIMKQYNEFKADIKAELVKQSTIIDDLRKEIHDFIINQNKNQ